MADYIPGPAAEFQTWQGNFVTLPGAKPADLGLETFITPLHFFLEPLWFLQ